MGLSLVTAVLASVDVASLIVAPVAPAIGQPLPDKALS